MSRLVFSSENGMLRQENTVFRISANPI